MTAPDLERGPEPDPDTFPLPPGWTAEFYRDFMAVVRKVAREAVRGPRRKSPGRKPAFDEAAVRRAAELVKGGMSRVRASKETGVPRATLARAWRKLGIDVGKVP